MDREPDSPGTGRFARWWSRAEVSDDGGGLRVRVARVAWSRRRKLWAVALAVVGVVAAILSRSLVSVFAFVPLLLLIPGSVRVDSERWPRLGRARRQPWDDVVAVLAPDRWTDHVAMVLTDGREAGTPIPGEWAQRVAQIGGVPLQQRQRQRWHHGQT